MAVYHRTQRLQIYGEKPEVTKLFGNRYRIVVRCKAARDTEAWYNANKDQIFASFGTLYSAQMSVDGIDPRVGEAYPDMCLVSNSASYTQTGEYIINFVYETLTAVWTKEQEDKVTSVANGLRVIDRSEVAKVDGFPIVKLNNLINSKIVLSGMGDASNHFVLLVKANLANTIYWRATNEDETIYTGSFTTASTDQWEYKVIYTPISIDQLEIGYDGTNYSTFDLSEFYVVSQSSDWQNNIVESFINFEVTVDNPSPFSDTVVFTGSNGNTATGTNVQSGGTGSISSHYDEDDVGVATITDSEKTLYLAGFRDETSTNPDFQIGRFITTWTEAGLISESRRSIGQGIYSVSSTFLAQEGSTTGPVISRETRDIDGLKVVAVTTYQDSDGNSIAETDGSDNLVHSFDTEENFTIPGVVRIKETSYRSENVDVTGIGLVPGKISNYGFDLIKPAVTLQRVRNYIFYTTDPYISDSDYQYDPDDDGGAAVGHWNPVDWAKSTISGASANGNPFYESKAYGNYRAANSTREFTETTRNAKYGYSNSPYILRPTVILDNAGNYISKLFINGYQVADKPSPMISVEGGPENPVGLRWTLSVAVGSTPSFEDLNGNSYYKKVVKICDVDGRGIDEELLQETLINKLGSYAFTDEGSGFYSIALHESYEEVDDFYNGNEIVIPFRNQTARNDYTGSIKSIIYDYNSSTNKILIKSSTALSGNYAGKYNGGDVTNINNFDTPRFTMIEHETASKIVRIQRQQNFGTGGGAATIIFDPTISTSGLDNYNIQFTSGECNGLTAPIENHWTTGTASNASYLLKIDCSDTGFSGFSLAVDDTFVLVSPESFT